MSYHIAVDIGGTFTDLVALDDDTGEVRVSKSSSLARDPIGAVLRVTDKTHIPPQISSFSSTAPRLPRMR
jgi:N-methylhydantoinase A